MQLDFSSRALGRRIAAWQSVTEVGCIVATAAKRRQSA
jgi:hypothetical protein